jgi:hypothetical protein
VKRAFAPSALSDLAFEGGPGHAIPLPPKSKPAKAKKRKPSLKTRIVKKTPDTRPNHQATPKAIADLRARLRRIDTRIATTERISVAVTLADYKEIVDFCDARDMRLGQAMTYLLRAGLAAEAAFAEEGEGDFGPAASPLASVRDLTRAQDARNSVPLPVERERIQRARQAEASPLRALAGRADLAAALRGSLPASAAAPVWNVEPEPELEPQEEAEPVLQAGEMNEP